MEFFLYETQQNLVVDRIRENPINLYSKAVWVQGVLRGVGGDGDDGSGCVGRGGRAPTLG